MTVQQQRDISRKLRVLNHAKESGNVSAACRYFGISRESFYQWKRAYPTKGEAGLINSKPCPENPKLRTPKETEEKILHPLGHLGVTCGECSTAEEKFKKSRYFILLTTQR